MRVLVVEDDELLAGALRRGLSAEGYAVEVAPDGVDGLHRATEFDYDVMILDVLLPGLDGVRVCAQLRAAARDLPVLMLTAKDGAADHVAGLDAGADDYLAKPFKYPVLLAPAAGAVAARSSPAAAGAAARAADPGPGPAPVYQGRHGTRPHPP